MGIFCLFDDNLEIIQEFSEVNRHIALVWKPRARRSHLLRQECIGWSIFSEPLLSTAKRFVKYFLFLGAVPEVPRCCKAASAPQREYRAPDFIGILLCVGMQGLGILL